MCRMAILHFSERGAITAHYMFDALIVSSNDGPYLKAIARDGRHCHGYGFVAALNDGRGWRVVYERFDAEPSLSTWCGAVFHDGRDRLLWDLRLPKPLDIQLL